MAGELDGRTALVTGGARGIGLACARALTEAGANVLITGRDADTGASAAAQLGDRARFHRQDVASEADWQRVMDTVQDDFGRLDILVANAGINIPAPLEAETLETFRHVCDINLKGCFLAVKHGTDALRRHGEGGSIILISSVMGRISAPAHVAYSGSKAGVRLLAKAAALELGPEGIRVNAVLPGITRSDMTAAFDEEQMAPMLVPMGRFGAPEEVAETVVFAASDRARFMTGAELVVDGGLVTR